MISHSRILGCLPDRGAGGDGAGAGGQQPQRGGSGRGVGAGGRGQGAGGRAHRVARVAAHGVARQLLLG